jgi:hypothetical protein
MRRLLHGQLRTSSTPGSYKSCLRSPKRSATRVRCIGADGAPEHEVAELLNFTEDALRPAPRPSAVDRQRRVGRHVGAAGEPDQLRGGHRRLRPLPRFPRQASPLTPPAVGPRCGARWPPAALLVARRRLAVRHRRPPLPASRVLVSGGLHRQTSALRGTAAADSESLLDSASYGARLVLLSPAAAAGVRGRSRHHP